MEWNEILALVIIIAVIIFTSAIITYDYYTKYKDALKEKENIQKERDEWQNKYISASSQSANKDVALQNFKKFFCNITSKIDRELYIDNKSSGFFLAPYLNEYTGSCKSNSMYPTLRCGDKFYEYKPKSIDELKVDDIITFKNPDGINVIHRIIEFYTESSSTKIYIRTKGDNNPMPDYWKTSFEDVIGKVIMIEPNSMTDVEPLITQDLFEAIIRIHNIDSSLTDCYLHPVSPSEEIEGFTCPSRIEINFDKSVYTVGDNTVLTIKIFDLHNKLWTNLPFTLSFYFNGNLKGNGTFETNSNGIFTENSSIETSDSIGNYLFKVIVNLSDCPLVSAESSIEIK